MRIMLFAAGGDIGGGKTHILSLAKELAKDNDLRLVSFRKGVLSEEGMEMGIDTVDTGGNNGILHSIRLAFRQAKDFRPDVIHCHGAKGNMMGILVKWFLHIPVMTTVHSDPDLDYLGAPVRNALNGNINKFCLRRMDYHVAVADRMRELLIQRGFDAQNIFAVYNGLDFEGSETGPRPPKHADDPITVGIAARLNPVKTLLRAFAKAYGQDERLRLSIAGSGEEEQELKALAKELHIEDVTTFEGWISDVKGYFRGVDINVLSSLSETFPYSLLEGAYVHCPAIASNVGGIPYLIQNEKTGLLFEAGDADAFADCILRLAKDPQLRTRLAENLYEKARTEFSLARMKEDQEAIYRTLIHRSQMLQKGRYGAILCGAYGKGNAGDDAILRAILTRLKAIDPDMPFYVMSRNPVETSMKERVGSFYIFNLRKFFKYLRKTSLFVSGGGTLIQDVTSSRSLYFYLFTLLAAKWTGSKVVMYGCGIGPIHGNANRRYTGRVLNKAADICSTRRRTSSRCAIPSPCSCCRISGSRNRRSSCQRTRRSICLRLAAMWWRRRSVWTISPPVRPRSPSACAAGTNSRITKRSQRRRTTPGRSTAYFPYSCPWNTRETWRSAKRSAAWSPCPTRSAAGGTASKSCGACSPPWKSYAACVCTLSSSLRQAVRPSWASPTTLKWTALSGTAAPNAASS